MRQALRRVVLCSAQIAKRVALMSQTSPAPCCMFRHHQRGTLGGLAMKKFLLGSVGLAAMLAGPAMAADMPIAAATAAGRLL